MIAVLLPTYDRAISKLYSEICTGLHMRDTLLSLFPPREVTHRGTTRQVSGPKLLDTEMRQHVTTVSVELDMLRRTDAIRFCEFLVTMITGLQAQQKAHILEVMCQTATTTGKYIQGKDRNLWDVYIETLETLDFGFDGDGEPLCQFYVPSELAYKLTAVLPTEAQMRRASEIVSNKRKKYFAAKRYRRLSL